MAKGQKVELTPEQKEAKRAEAKAARAANFVKLADARVNKSLDAIAVIGNLASPNYVYTQEQVAVIKSVLTAQVEKTMALFAPKGDAPTAKGFSLAAAVAEPAPAEQPEQAA